MCYKLWKQKHEEVQFRFINLKKITEIIMPQDKIFNQNAAAR